MRLRKRKLLATCALVLLSVGRQAAAPADTASVADAARIALDVFNKRASDIDYYYASRLPGEAADWVNDRHFHPVEPRSARLTLSYAF
ncbi:hypothetical protein [Janthinobacterium sp. RB2P8]|uniref:hypothetical protein n=1 Tax=Janthinobacterium sp. RB2P8 TaxID=3424191 RepID=UPI003F24660F